jgi:hypothetical protein
VYGHLKTAAGLINGSFKLVVAQMCLWGVAWLICMHGGGLENVNKIFSQDVLLQTAMILGNVTCGEGRLY